MHISYARRRGPAVAPATWGTGKSELKISIARGRGRIGDGGVVGSSHPPTAAISHEKSAPPPLPGGLKPGLGPLRGRVLKDMTWK